MAKIKPEDLPAGELPAEPIQFEQPDLRTKKASGGGGGSVYTHPHTGDQVPSVTTISGMIDKSGFLVPWSAKLAGEYAHHNVEVLAGIDEPEVAAAFIAEGGRRMRDRGKDLGSRVHNAIEALCVGAQVDIEDDLVHHFAGWQEWLQNFRVKRVLIVEFTVWSHRYRYAGTADVLVEMEDGSWVLVDYKTGKDVHSDAAMQMIALARADVMVTTAGEAPMPTIHRAGVLHLPAPVLTPKGRQSVRGKWSYRDIPLTGPAAERTWETFLALRSVYDWEKEVAPTILGGKQTAPPTTKES